jgi:hypothetical protein
MEAPPVPVLRFVCDSVCSVSWFRVSVRSVVPCVARRSGVRRVARGRGGPLPPEPDPDYFTPTILTADHRLKLFTNTINLRRSAALIRPRSPRVPIRPTPRTRAIY